MNGYQRKTLRMEAEYGSGEMQDACRAALARITELESREEAVRKLVEATRHALAFIEGTWSYAGLDRAGESKTATLLKQALEPFAGLETPPPSTVAEGG